MKFKNNNTMRNIFYSLILIFVIWVLVQPRPTNDIVTYHNDYRIDSNYLTPIEPLTESVNTMSVVPKRKENAVDLYIKRYSKTAVEEMKLYGIPASITLAQGIVESNAGRSNLSVKHNNHFGMKWRKGRAEGYAVYSDDSPRDKFVVYKSAWRSFRDHSILLAKSDRYKRLFKSNDYKRWAKGLKDCGYATNKSYDKMLISVIEKYKLYKFDNK